MLTLVTPDEANTVSVFLRHNTGLVVTFIGNPASEQSQSCGSTYCTYGQLQRKIFCIYILAI